MTGAIRPKRKSRGRGLRTTTGCSTCKRRHVKCDEAQPQCGPCAKGHRPCVYASRGSQYGDSVQSSTEISRNNSRHIHPPLQVLVDACDQEQPLDQLRPAGLLQASSTSSPTVKVSPAQIPSTCPTSETVHGFAPSPGTEISGVSTRAAPLSWFELLARDAVNADSGFLLSPPQRSPHTPENGEQSPENSSNLQPRSWRERQSFQAAAFQRVPGMEGRLNTTHKENPLSDDPSPWTTSSPIPLSDLERRIFNHFVHFSSQWLDFYDPINHFSTTVPHLALQNLGLMRALLALTARHISLGHKSGFWTKDAALRRDTEQIFQSETLFPTVDRNLAVEYYYETLHYLNKAMQHPSYTRSHELVATALLISVYEMIDGSNQDWERHLKGVFWIQRFQDNDGESGGLRQAVWWAWIRQDVWVAMRERRRVFSFWQPKRPLSILMAPELAMRATWLLGQCVNYASMEEQGTTDLCRRLERGRELLCMLQQWHEQLPSEYNFLPTVSETQIFPPIWVHPPNYAAALQVHSLARILVILHRPSSGSLQDYRAAQKLLTLSVNTICGIARCVEPGDIAASVGSLQCIFGAGMCVSSPQERLALLDLLDSHQRRVHWPSTSLRKELELEYAKDEYSDFAGGESYLS